MMMLIHNAPQALKFATQFNRKTIGFGSLTTMPLGK